MIQTGDHHMLAFLTAQTSMRDSPLPMERPEVSHTHRLDITAPPTTNLSRRRMIQTGDHHTLLFLIAQTSMRDSPSLTERPEVSHTHKLDITAPPTTNLSRRRMIQTGDHHTPLFLIAQTSMRDSPSPTERPEVSHTHRLDITAPLTTNLPRRRMIQTGDHHMPVFHTAQTSMRDSPSLTVRPEVSHTHRLDITAPPTTNLLRRRIQTGDHHMPVFH